MHRPETHRPATLPLRAHRLTAYLVTVSVVLTSALIFAVAALGQPTITPRQPRAPEPTGAAYQRIDAGHALQLISPADRSSIIGVDQPGGATCVTMPMDCNSTVGGTLTTTDCADAGFPGVFADFWFFAGTDGQTIVVDASSSDFDIGAGLVDPDANVVAQDDDSGPGTDARFNFTLDETGLWQLAVLNVIPSLFGDPGDYFIQLDCSAVGGGPPAAPSNLSATALSSDEIELGWQDNSNNEDDFEVQIRPPGSGFQDLGAVGADSIGALVSNLDPNTTYDFRVRARNQAGSSAWSNTASATTFPDAGFTCAPDATTMCLNQGRFQVEVDWRDFSSSTGDGMVVPFGSDDSGMLWFFSPDNWEMLIKVLDGCAINDRFWVFAAATTTVEYTLRVTDSDTGVVKEYFNPLGVAPPAITDTQAFATCP